MKISQKMVQLSNEAHLKKREEEANMKLLEEQRRAAALAVQIQETKDSYPKIIETIRQAAAKGKNDVSVSMSWFHPETLMSLLKDDGFIVVRNQGTHYCNAGSDPYGDVHYDDLEISWG